MPTLAGMTCPHPPGRTRPRSGKATGALLTIALALLWPSAGQAAPQAAHAPAASASQPKATKKKAAPAKPAKKGTRATTSKHRRATKAGTAGAAAGTGAAAATPADPPDNPPDSGIRLPLMLRTIPSLPDNPAALQARLDSLIAMQGAAGQGAQASGVRQLGPDIYAFSLHCADAAQCQRLRLAIEGERDWVAGLQLDERRNIPKTPDRHAPSAR